MNKYVYTMAAAAIMLLPLNAYAQVAGETTITVPWGAAVGGALDAIWPTLGMFASGFLALFGGKWYALLKVTQVDQLLANALNNGIEHVRHDLENESFSLDVRSKVVAQAVNYAMNHGAKRLLQWMGGREAIVGMVEARLQDALARWATSQQIIKANAS